MTAEAEAVAPQEALAGHIDRFVDETRAAIDGLAKKKNPEVVAALPPLYWAACQVAGSIAGKGATMESRIYGLIVALTDTKIMKACRDELARIEDRAVRDLEQKGPQDIAALIKRIDHLAAVMESPVTMSEDGGRRAAKRSPVLRKLAALNERVDFAVPARGKLLFQVLPRSRVAIPHVQDGNLCGLVMSFADASVMVRTLPDTVTGSGSALYAWGT